MREDDADFFPLRILASLSLIQGDIAATIKAVDRLREKSKERRGWGYSIHYRPVRSREFGNNPQPDRITIDTLDDLLRLSRQTEHFAATREVVSRVREILPRLHRLPWLHDNRLIYWGDIDVDGFRILSSLRNLFPHLESIIMDRATLEQHSQYVIPGNRTTPSLPSNLNEEESATFLICSKHNQRLEQERVLQPFVDSAFITRIDEQITAAKSC